MYLFGSHLVNKLFPGIKYRKPNDIDYVTNNLDEYQAALPNQVIGKEEYYYIPCTPDRELTPDEYYTLKVSHAIYDIHWSKTMSDVRFLQLQGCKIIPEFLQELREHWNNCPDTHGVQRRTDFEVKPGKFFEDRVQRKVNHDELHVRLVTPDEPSYKHIIATPESVKPEPELFYSLPVEQQIKVVQEEAFVIAVERFSDLHPLNAYHVAQKNLVTRLHPLWLADHIIQNWQNNHYWVPTKSCWYQRYTELMKQ